MLFSRVFSRVSRRFGKKSRPVIFSTASMLSAKLLRGRAEPMFENTKPMARAGFAVSNTTL